MSKTREKNFSEIEENNPELKNMLDNLQWVKDFLNKFEVRSEKRKLEQKLRFYRGF